MPLTYATIADRPDLVEAMWRLPNPWPRFMQQDVVSDFVYDLLPKRYPEYQLLAAGRRRGRGAGQRCPVRMVRSRR